MDKKKIIVGLIALIGVLLICTIIFVIMYFKKPTYKIKVKTGGGVITRDIVVKDNVIESLPEIKPPKNKVLVTWVNQKKEAVRPNLKITEDITLEPVFEEEKRETVTLKFETYTDEKIPDIVITKGTIVILPVKPTHNKWKFLYWVDKDGYIVLKDKRIYEDTTIYAYWFKSDNEEVTIKYETGTDEVVEDIKLTKGSKLIFPTLTKEKEGMVFRGWLDTDGNLLNNESIANEDMTLTANWKTPYTCPENCTPNEDGKTCTRSVTVNPTIKKVCKGTVWHGYCLDFSKKESGAIRQCAAMGNDESDEVWYTTDTEDWCVKKMAWTEKQVCPKGYEMAETKCSKEETVNCKAN